LTRGWATDPQSVPELAEIKTIRDLSQHELQLAVEEPNGVVEVAVVGVCEDTL
jgi:hypothetical protein